MHIVVRCTKFNVRAKKEEQACQRVSGTVPKTRSNRRAVIKKAFPVVTKEFVIFCDAHHSRIAGPVLNIILEYMGGTHVG